MGPGPSTDRADGGDSSGLTLGRIVTFLVLFAVTALSAVSLLVLF